MSFLFEPIEINNITLTNRIIRSATYEACADEKGRITDNTIELYSRLAQGEIGMIVTGLTYVHKSGQFVPQQAAIDNDDCLPGLKRLVDEVHKYDAKITVQLAHSGKRSYVHDSRGEIPLAPSLIDADPGSQKAHREISVTEIEEIIDAFGHAARRAREAGFDAVQLHGAHSYLFSQFLSPLTNRRTDQWGGDLEGRMRFHIQITKVMRNMVGQDYPLLIKLGVKDEGTDGLTLEEGCRVAQALSFNGMDAIEVSEGMEEQPAHHIRKNIKFWKEEAYYAEWAKEVKKTITIPVISVGGMRSPDIMEKLIREDYTDCIAMCRPFIREPFIIQRWQTKDRKPAKCISCNLCVERVIRQNEPLVCVQEIKLNESREKQGQEK
ncbi:NADH:flavin oxidoreductase [Chloroflexota bacterium]